MISSSGLSHSGSSPVRMWSKKMRPNEVFSSAATEATAAAHMTNRTADFMPDMYFRVDFRALDLEPDF